MIAKRKTMSQAMLRKIVNKIKARRIKSQTIPKPNPEKVKIFLRFLRIQLANAGLSKADIQKLTGKRILDPKEVHKIAKKINPTYFDKLRISHFALNDIQNIENLNQSIVVIKSSRISK